MSGAALLSRDFYVFQLDVWGGDPNHIFCPFAAVLARFGRAIASVVALRHDDIP